MNDSEITICMFYSAVSQGVACVYLAAIAIHRYTAA